MKNIVKKIRVRTWISLGAIMVLGPIAFLIVFKVSASPEPPTAYWKFDEGVDNTCSGGTNDACDSSGNAKDLANNSATWSNQDVCYLGNCVSMADTTGNENQLITTWSADIDESGNKYPSDGNGDWVGRETSTGYRSAALFDLSSVTGTVTKVEIQAYVNGVNNASSLLFDIHPYAGDGTGNPSTDSGATAYTSAASGTPYVNDTTTFRTTGSKTITLGDGSSSQAAIDVQAQLGSTFAIGIQEESDTGSGTSYISLDEYDQSNPLTLIVTTDIGTFFSRADDADFDFSSSDNFSIGGWFRHPEISASSDYLITKHGNTGSDGGYKVWMDNDGDIHCGIDDDDTFDPDAETYSTNANYDDNKWHHFECVKSGTASLTLYIDSTQVNQNTSISGVGTLVNSDSIVVGADGSTFSNAWGGFVDELKVYTYARSAAEVKTDVIRGAEIRGAAASFGNTNTDFLTHGLIGYWRLDETSGNATDSSGNALTLTNNGTTTYTTSKFGYGSEHVPASSQYFSTATTISGVKTVSFWVNPDSNTNYYVSLTSSAYITSSSGTLSATGFTDPKIYVNGVETSTIAANTWQLVTITDTTAINSNQFYLGRQSTNYFDGTFDEVRVYNRVLSPAEARRLYNWAPGPVGYWPMDEATSGDSQTIFDHSGNSNNGTTTDNESDGGMDCSIPGKFGGGCTLDGSNDFISVSDSSSLSPTGSITLSAWVYPKANTASTVYSIASKGNDAYRLIQYGDEIRMYAGSTSNYETTTSTNLAVNTWYYISGVYNAPSASITIYVNGTAQSSTTTGTIPTSITDNTSVLYLGSQGNITSAGSSLDLTVTSGTDDARINDAGYSDSETTMIIGGVGTSPDTNYGQGFRFQNVTIPNGATVSSAYLTFVKDTTDWLSVCWRLTAIDEDNTTTFSSGSPPGSRSITSSYIASETVNVSHSNGISYSFPTTAGLKTTLGSAINAVINRPGWSSGNALAIVNNSDQDASACENFGREDYRTYDYGTPETNAPKLHIDYSATPDAFPFNGSVDEVKIYNYTRTPQQIIEDMNGGHPTGGSPIGTATSYWKFDETAGTTAYDANATSGNNLTLSTASWTTSGKYNSAWNGNGTAYLSRADDSDFDVGATDNYSVSLWFKSDATSNPGSTEYLFSKANATTAGYAVYANTSGNLCFAIDDDATWSPDVASCSPTDSYDNTWHHLVAVRNVTADQTQLYIDGLLVDSDTDTTTATLANSLSLYIGDRDGTDNGDEFNGDLDEIKIFRDALSADEVKLLYNANSVTNFGTGVREASALADGAGNPPVGYWNFNENTGDTVYDKSGNNVNLTRYGNAAYVPGKVGSSMTFDGSETGDTTHASVQTDSYDSQTTGTLCTWVKPYDTGDAVQSFVAIAEDDDGSHTDWMYMGFQPSSDAIFFNLSDNNVTQLTVGAGTITPNQWSHFCITMASTGNSLYLNGTKVTSPTYSVGSASTDVWIDNIAENSTGLSIGCLDGNISIVGCSAITQMFEGQVDEVKLWDYALTPAQIAYDYNRGAPVAWYKLDECTGTTIYDAAKTANGTATGNNGTWSGASGTNTSAGTCSSGTGSEAWNNGTTGKLNASLDFDGTDDIVTVSPSTPINNLTQVSITAWIYPNSFGENSRARIIDKNQVLGGGWAFYIDSGIYCGGSNRFDFHHYWSSSTDALAVWCADSNTISTGKWQHVAVTYDVSSASNDAVFYLNGKQVGTTEFHAPSGTTGDDSSISLTLGNKTATDRTFDGQIDDVRVYNYILSGAQIKRIMQDGPVGSAARFGPETGSP